MKKIIASALMLIAASTATFAQHSEGTVTLQPKVGVNIASITENDGADPRIGLAAGLELEYQATDIFSLSAGAIYSMQGAKAEAGGVTATTKLDYINIPIMANVYVAKGLAVKLGIQPGFNVNASTDIKFGSTNSKWDLKDYVNSFDFTIPVGISYEYSNFVLDARYNWGLTKVFDLSDNAKKFLDGDIDCKNSVFAITVGYKFDL